jgi:LysM repeat protein
MPRPPWSDARGSSVEAERTTRRTVTVYKGDSLWSLAFAYGLSVDELLRANAGLSERSMRPGMKLLLPTETDSGAGAPWMRWDGREHAPPQTGARQKGAQQQRRGAPVPRLLAALAAGVALGALRSAPGPVGDAARAAFDGAGNAAAAVHKAAAPVAESTARGVLPFCAKLVGALKFAGRTSANAIIHTLGGTPGRSEAAEPRIASADAAEAAASAGAAAAAARADSARVRAELAQAHALSAAAEAARHSLARELAAALSAVEALTQAEHTQRELAAAEAQRAQELQQQLTAVRVLVVGPDALVVAA